MQFISTVTLVIDDYDEAIRFYTGSLGFELIEGTQLDDKKRWVLVAPRGSNECRLLLAVATDEAQKAAIGNQTGGRVFLFLRTDDFDRDYQKYVRNGVRFEEAPRTEAYGKVAVFSDPFGNKWDLIEPIHNRASGIVTDQ